jgi:hypothetical protein
LIYVVCFIVDGNIFIEYCLGRQQMHDLFPEQIHALTSTMNSLDMNDKQQQISSAIHTHHAYPAAARVPRIMKIPLTNRLPFSVRHFLLEFDHSTIDYYTEIDTIVLCSQKNEQPYVPLLNVSTALNISYVCLQWIRSIGRD